MRMTAGSISADRSNVVDRTRDEEDEHLENWRVHRVQGCLRHAAPPLSGFIWNRYQISSPILKQKNTKYFFFVSLGLRRCGWALRKMVNSRLGSCNNWTNKVSPIKPCQVQLSAFPCCKTYKKSIYDAFFTSWPPKQM